MNKILSQRRPLVLVFIPYTETGGRLESPCYDDAGVRADIDRWMTSIGCAWRWVPIAPSTLEAEIEAAAALFAERSIVVFNLCDGDDVNGYPGLSVVKALEVANLPFTGARSRFYELSTSKRAMKRCFNLRGVRTAPFVPVRDVEVDIRRAGETLGWPIFIKPDISAGSCGITPLSKAWNVEEGMRAAKMALAGLHGYDFCKGGLVAEPYLGGREFTVLVVRERASPDGVWALTPAERVFDPAMPVEQRFLTCMRVTGEGEALDAGVLPPDHYAYNYFAAPEERQAELMDLARRAFLAIDGTGYARVDIRYDAEPGRPHVLEVNANCGISADETTSVGGILQLSNTPVSALMSAIMSDALVRHRRRRPVAAVAHAATA